MKGCFRADRNPDPEQLLKVLYQAGMIQQAPSWLPSYQQIEVAAFIGFAAGDGPEHSNVLSAAPAGNPQDLYASFFAE
jgi:hypothetical protein